MLKLFQHYWHQNFRKYVFIIKFGIFEKEIKRTQRLDYIVTKNSYLIKNYKLINFLLNKLSMEYYDKFTTNYGIFLNHIRDYFDL
jgi:hypothetical protein